MFFSRGNSAVLTENRNSKLVTIANFIDCDPQKSVSSNQHAIIIHLLKKTHTKFSGYMGSDILLLHSSFLSIPCSFIRYFELSVRDFRKS